jgi:hypothetical protein
VVRDTKLQRDDEETPPARRLCGVSAIERETDENDRRVTDDPMKLLRGKVVEELEAPSQPRTGMSLTPNLNKWPKLSESKQR